MPKISLSFISLKQVVNEEVVSYGEPARRKKIGHAKDVAEVSKALIGDESQEVVIAFFLNTKMEIVGVQEVTRGTLNESLIHPREIFKGAILNNAHSVIVVHNHPSGDLNPSSADKAVCARLKKAGDLLGIKLMDFAITSDKDFYSFRDRNEASIMI